MSLKKTNVREIEYSATMRNAESIERIVPAEIRSGQTTGDETLALHLQRYEFAARYGSAGRMLDIACGVGYGTRLLADRCDSVNCTVGVDLSAEAIAYAKQHYQNNRTLFLTGDAMSFEDRQGFDTIVTLETIEHLPNSRGFVDHLVGLLRPAGILVASVPTTPSVDANPHHLHDFSETSFRRLFIRHKLIEIDYLVQVQPFRPLAVVNRTESRMAQMRGNLPAYYVSHPSSLLRRIWSTLRYGFTNRYITIAWQAPD